MPELQMPAPTLDQIVGDPQSEPDVPETPESGSPDTTETVAETDEQKNARELAERQERTEKRARGVQKRLDELTADKYAERAAREAAERRLQAYEAQRQPAPAPTDAEPKRESFADYEQYVEARAEWRAIRAVEARMQEAEQRQAQQRQREQAEQGLERMQQALNVRLAEYTKTHPEFKDAIEAHDEQVPIPAAMAVMQHKDAPLLMQHMGQNPDFVVSLQSLHPQAQLVAIGELAAELRRAPQVSKAPAPGKPVGSRGGSPKEPSEMTRDEYYDHITKGRGKKR